MATTDARSTEDLAAESLPPYLGFGTLDQASVRLEGERLRARYQYADGGTAYRVDWRPRLCLLDALFREELISFSGGPHLQDALFRSFVTMGEPALDPRFVDMGQSIVASGNIHFQFPQAFRRGRAGAVYYPAGLLFSLLLPVVRDYRSAWDVFSILTMKRQDVPMELLSEGLGAIISLMPERELRVEEIEISQFVTPLCRVVDACRTIAEHQLIAPGQMYRMTVTDASVAAAEGLQVYQGHEVNGPDLFAVVPADPTSELSWKDQVALAGDRLVELARDPDGDAGHEGAKE